MSLSAPVTVQLREYINPTIGVVTLAVTLTVMDGTGDEKTREILNFIESNQNHTFTHSAQ